MDWAQLGITVLGELGGGHGSAHEELTRFGLGAIFWLGLIFASWRRPFPKAEARERLLLLGFLAGLGREVFMFWVYALQLQGVLRAAEIEPYFPPIDHTLRLLSLVLVAAAFLRYLLPSARTAFRYLWGLGALTLGAYVVTAPWWWSASLHDPVLRFSHVWCDGVFHGLGAGALLVAIALLLRRRGDGRLRYFIALVLGLWFLDDALMLWNLQMGMVHRYTIDPIRHNLHLWAIPLLGLVYLRETQAAAGRAHARAEASRAALEESIRRERVELKQRETLQEELLQSQKLEAVGRLADRKSVV